VWNVETGWVHAIDDITFQVKYDKYATLVSRAETETEQPAIAWRVEAVGPERPVESFHEAEAEPLSGIGMIRIKHGTWALNGSTGKDSDEDSLDPDYVPEESMDSQSDPDSEDEYIEERARRARNRPVSPAKPGEDAMMPVTAVKQEPMGGDDPHRTLSSDAVAESRQPLRQEAPRRSSTTEDAELSDVGAVVRVSGWALVDQRAGEAPRWSSIMETAESSNAGSVVEVPSWASEIPVFGTAPRLEPESEPVVMTNQASERPDVIVVESADGVREEYIVKSEVDSSGEETGAP